MTLEEPHDHKAAAVWSAAISAEREIGDHESTVEAAERHVLLRVAYAALGFVLIGVGIAALPLPGPGWLIILAGLSMLPFRWAQRTIRLIRARIPGVPEEGSIPLRTWIIMGAIVVAATVVSIWFRQPMAQWFSDTWTDLSG